MVDTALTCPDASSGSVAKVSLTLTNLVRHASSSSPRPSSVMSSRCTIMPGSRRAQVATSMSGSRALSACGWPAPAAESSRAGGSVSGEGCLRPEVPPWQQVGVGWQLNGRAGL